MLAVVAIDRKSIPALFSALISSCKQVRIDYTFTRERGCDTATDSVGPMWMALADTLMMTDYRIAIRREDVRFRVLRLIERRPEASQREIADALGVSVGAVNFCMRALIDKGHIKVANFRASKNKLGYVYVLTPEGISHRASLAVRFIERKLAEYNAIKDELDQLQSEFWDIAQGSDGLGQ